MSKTPYEIRLEILRLANEILTTPVHANRDSAMREYQSSRETYPGEAGPRNPLEFPKLPEFPTTEEVLKEAELLNNFVSKS